LKKCRDERPERGALLRVRTSRPPVLREARRGCRGAREFTRRGCGEEPQDVLQVRRARAHRSRVRARARVDAASRVCVLPVRRDWALGA
jgi:hypothetical protein